MSSMRAGSLHALGYGLCHLCNPCTTGGQRVELFISRSSFAIVSRTAKVAFSFLVAFAGHFATAAGAGAKAAESEEFPRCLHTGCVVVAARTSPQNCTRVCTAAAAGSAQYIAWLSRSTALLLYGSQ
jgi:hypothetical protein